MENNILTDERVDTLINTRLSQFRVKGGSALPKKVGWSDEEIQIMDNVIWSYLVTKGMSRENTAKQLTQRWDIALSTARKYVSECIKRMSNIYTQEDIETKRQMFLQRCEQILTDAIESRQKDTALKALDLYAKASGFYKEAKDVNVTAEGNIKFDFS